MGAPPGNAERPPARNPVRQWVYTQSVRGRWQQVHRATGLLLQAILVVVPWLTVGGHPAVQIDLPGRRLYTFGAIFTPRDTLFLVLLLLFVAFSLFFLTSLFGRLWCGYVCPQTVFLEEWIRPVERWIEGERGTRMARDRRGPSWDLVWRKSAKWAVFGLVAVVVAMSFVSWFAGARALWTGQAPAGAYGVTWALAALMFFDFAWFREQFCNFLCPYARFQGALCDDQSLVVGYDAGRGEPRRFGGKGPLADSPLLPGACIDCKKCVAVCPQGIDIREGFQLECITCGRCVDACTGVMEKQGLPSLVSYTQLRRGPLIRPRTVAYAGLLSAIAVAFLVLLVNRHDVDANISRAPGTLFTLDADGWVRNTWLLRVTSKADAPTVWTVAMEGLPGGSEVLAGEIPLAVGATLTVPVVVRVPPGQVRGGESRPVTVRVSSDIDEVQLAASFLGGS